MARVQVRDLPSAPRLQATVQSGGDFGVAVQQAGSNKMLDLADTLSGFNTALKEYGALGRVQGQIGAEEALLVSDADVLEEIRKTEPDTFLSIQRNKAYRNTLLKRAVNNNLLPAMQSSADELLDLEKYKNQGEFLEAVDGFMQGQWEAFSEEVGQDAANSDGGKVLWNAVTGPFKADMLKAYDKKMDDFVVNGQAEELGLELDMMTRRRIDPNTGQPIGLDTAGLQLTAQNREQLLKEAGVNDPKLRSKIIVNAYVKQVDALLANGRYADAERMLAAMNVIQVNKKPIFRTTDAKTLMNPLRRSLESALRASSTESDASKRREFSGRVLSIYVRTKTGVVSDITKKELSEVYGMMGATDAQIEELTDQVASAENPTRAFYDSLNALANSKDLSDEGEKLYYDTFSGILKDLADVEKTPLSPTRLALSEQQDYVKEYEQWIKQGNVGGADEWMRETFGNNPPFRLKGFKELEDASKRLTKGDYILDRDEYKEVKATLGKIFKSITDDPPRLEEGMGRKAKEEVIEAVAATFLFNSTKIVQERLKAKAVEVADLSEEEITASLKDEFNKVIAEEKRLFKERVEVLGASLAADKKRIEQTEVDTESQKEEMDRFGWFTGEKYDTLDGIDKTTSFADVKKDRDAMIEAKDERSLARSLYHYGFDSWNVDNLELLLDANPPMDADDVKLFGSARELQTKIIEWGSIIRKEENRETLTPTEKRVKEEYRKLGIYNEETLFLFADSQETFFIK